MVVMVVVIIITITTIAGPHRHTGDHGPGVSLPNRGANSG